MTTADYVLATPSRILTATHGGVAIATRLYGEVSDERLVRERQIVARRAEQLSGHRTAAVESVAAED
jgi:hypothetical protein